MNGEDELRWTIVSKEAIFDQFKLDLCQAKSVGTRHLLTRSSLDSLSERFGTSDVVLVEIGHYSGGFDFVAAGERGLSVPFVLRSRIEGQFLGVCRFGLHKQVFEALVGVGQWWELRSGTRSSSENLRKLLNRVTDGIAELDADDRIRWVNTALKSALPDIDWCGAKLSSIVVEKDRVRLQTLREQHGSGVVVPFAVHLPNGKQVVLDPSPWFDEQGALVGTSLVFRQVYESTQEESRANELYCLYSLVSAIGRSATVEEALQTAVQRSVELLGLSAGGYVFCSQERVVTDQHGQDLALHPELVAHFDELSHNFPKQKKALVERVLGQDHPVRNFGVAAYAVLPLELSEGRSGSLWFVSKEEGAFARETISLLISATQQLSVVTENLFYNQNRLVAELDKKRFYKDALCAVTGGKLMLCEREDLESVWSDAGEDQGGVEILGVADVPKARRFIEEALALQGLLEEKIADAALCTTEAAGNVVKHADTGAVAVRTNERVVTIRIEDSGPGIDFAQLPNAVLAAGYSTAPSLGMGYSILLEMMDRVYLSTQKGGTRILLELHKVEADPLEAFAHLFQD